MRLLFVIPYYLPAVAFGGPVSVAARLAQHMAARGHAVTVVTTDVASRAERTTSMHERIDGVRVERIRNLSHALVATNVYTPLGAKRRLRALIAESDVVHLHELFHWLAFRAGREAARQGKPLLLSGHGSLSVSRERGRIAAKRIWLWSIGRSTIEAARLVQVATQYEGDRCVSAGVPRDKVRIVPQGVLAPPRPGDRERFRTRFGLDDRPVFLYVGRLRASKGVDLLLAAAKRLIAHEARPMFVLVGPAENRDDLQHPGRLAENVLLTGALHDEGLDDAYRAASAFVLPSFAEGMSVAALDALAHGVPCVLSHACNLPEVAEAGAGLIVDTTEDSLVAGIEALLAHAAEWPSMAAAAARLVVDRFDIERIHARYEALYEELRDA